jgi:hypothetical protein
MKNMEMKIIGSIPELMAEVGAVDYLVRVGCGNLLPAVLGIEAEAEWVKCWMNKPVIKDPNLTEADEKRLWENFELMKKAQG